MSIVHAVDSHARDMAARALDRSERAEAKAEVAADRALDVYQRLGDLAAQGGRIEEKIDACITDGRAHGAEVRSLRAELRLALGTVGKMRAKVDTLSNLDVEGMTAQQVRREKRRIYVAKALRILKRAGVAALVSLGPAAVALLAAWLAGRLGIHLPNLEIGP